MKAIYFCFWVALPSSALAQSDSGSCPFKLPFNIEIEVHGRFYDSNELGGSDTSISSFTTGWTLDTAKDSFSVHGDTLAALYRAPFSSGSFFMLFDSSTKTIRYLSIESSEEQFDYQSGQVMGSTSSSVTLSNFSYDSVSIFTPDSSLSDHQALAGYNQWQQNSSIFHDGWSSTLVSVTSISLSGNFRPVTLNVAHTPSIDSGPLTCMNDYGVLRFSMLPSSRARTLELYTPLGAKIVNLEIAAGQSEAMLPNIPSGLYFVRLDGQLLKVAVP